MSRRSVSFLFVGAALLLVILCGAAPVGAAQSAAASSGTAACLHGGWRSFSDPQGHPFRNQGQCVTWMRFHPVTLADLAGSFTGGTGSSEPNGGTCPAVGADYYLTFDTTYPGSAAVGTVALHYEGCAHIQTDEFTPGTFRISTNVGALSGTATGSFTATLDRNFDVTLDFFLAFTPTSGTGAFANTTGVLGFTQHVPPFSPTTGTIIAQM
jgi:hypothetical protein